jgi:hypothetical protein
MVGVVAATRPKTASTPLDACRPQLYAEGHPTGDVSQLAPVRSRRELNTIITDHTKIGVPVLAEQHRARW